MHWFYLVSLTIVLLLAAKFLWKVEQVYSVAVLLTGLISLIWGFTIAPDWGQLLITGLLFAVYQFYSPRRKIA